MYIPSVLLVELCCRAKHCAHDEILLSKSIENAPGRMQAFAQEYLIDWKEAFVNTGILKFFNSTKGFGFIHADMENLEAA